MTGCGFVSQPVILFITIERINFLSKYIGWDIEVTRIDIDNWESQDPLAQITCAALSFDDEPTKLYYNAADEGQPMNGVQLSQMIDHMVRCVRDGYTIATWNGLKLDFKLLYLLTKNEDVRCLAANHADMMLTFMCCTGYYAALKNVEGQHGITRTGDKLGVHAYEVWEQGDYQSVLDYVIEDADNTLLLANDIANCGQIKRLTQRGAFRAVDVPTVHTSGDQPPRLLTVKESISLPHPDTSWMRDPGPMRSDHYDWIQDLIQPPVDEFTFN